MDVDVELRRRAELRAGGSERVDRRLTGHVRAPERPLRAEQRRDREARRLQLRIDLGRERAHLGGRAGHALELRGEGRVDLKGLLPAEREDLLRAGQLGARRRGRGGRGGGGGLARGGGRWRGGWCGRGARGRRGARRGRGGRAGLGSAPATAAGAREEKGRNREKQKAVPGVVSVAHAPHASSAGRKYRHKCGPRPRRAERVRRYEEGPFVPRLTGADDARRAPGRARATGGVRTTSAACSSW